MFHQGRFDHLNPAVQAFVDPVDMLAAFDPLLALAAVDPSAALNAISRATRFLNPALNPAAALLAFNPQAAPLLAISNPVAATLPVAAARQLYLTWPVWVVLTPAGIGTVPGAL